LFEFLYDWRDLADNCDNGDNGGEFVDMRHLKSCCSDAEIYRVIGMRY